MVCVNEEQYIYYITPYCLASTAGLGVKCENDYYKSSIDHSLTKDRKLHHILSWTGSKLKSNLPNNLSKPLLRNNLLIIDYKINRKTIKKMIKMKNLINLFNKDQW